MGNFRVTGSIKSFSTKTLRRFQKYSTKDCAKSAGRLSRNFMAERSTLTRIFEPSSTVKSDPALPQITLNNNIAAVSYLIPWCILTCS